MSQKPRRSRAFSPVPLRPRSDGWTAERQVGFVEALAASANVEAACRAVGMSTSAAYALRARPEAAAFREAWQQALDYAVHRLAEAALDRAINGVATPVFYKGEQVGERRRYDERLTQFLLRLRDPDRFGSWRDGRVPGGLPDGPARLLGLAVEQLSDAAFAEEAGAKPRRFRPLPQPPLWNGDEDKLMAELRVEALRDRYHDHREAEHHRRVEMERARDLDDLPEVDTGGGT
jgi:hypothetical protein